MKFGFDLDTTPDEMIRLGLVVDDETVWPRRGQGDGCSNFDPEDVLSYLADSYPSLMLSQIWPIQFAANEEPRSITGLLRASEERWEQFGDDEQDQAEREQALIDEFLYHHDLSQMKHGAGVPPCYVLKQQRRVRIETGQEILEGVLFADFAKELIVLGDFAVDLLRKRIGRGDDRAARLIARWSDREEVEPTLAAALITGLARSEIDDNGALGKLLFGAVSGRKLTDIANDNSSPIPAAARSSGALGPAGMVAVLEKIQAFAPGDPQPLAKRRRELRGALKNIVGPTDQGIRAALVGRSWLRLQDDEPVNLHNLSNLLGISVDQADVGDDRLDGIACANAQHGPAILLNRGTRRHGGKWDDLDRSIRFTWAHEIGHLLLDDEEWPALVDAVLQRMPRTVETRANAFATYLLLPMSAAYRAWESDGMPLQWADMEVTLNSISQTYGLPRIVVARQMARGAPIERRRSLESVFRANIPVYGNS